MSCTDFVLVLTDAMNTEDSSVVSMEIQNVSNLLYLYDQLQVQMLLICDVLTSDIRVELRTLCGCAGRTCASGYFVPCKILYSEGSVTAERHPEFQEYGTCTHSLGPSGGIPWKIQR